MHAKKSKFIAVSSTAMLAIASVVSKIIGAFYRIPLTNFLGAEGIGLYQTFFPVYALFITLTSSGLSTVVSRFTAFADAVNVNIAMTQKGARNIALILGFSGSVLLALLSYPIALLQSREGMFAGYLLISPAVLFVSLSGYYKGYFIGKNKTVYNALSQTLEQTVKLIVGLATAWILSPKGVYVAVSGALIAVVVSEFFSLIFVRTCYSKEFPDNKNNRICVDKRIYYDIIKSILPLLASSLVLPIIAFVDSFMIVRLLTANGESLQIATQSYGLLGGAVSTIVNLPIVIAISLAVAVVPKVSSSLATGQYERVKQSTSTAIAVCAFIAIPCFFALYILSEDVIKFLYGGFSLSQTKQAATLLKVQSINVISLSLLQLMAGILQAMGKSRSVLFYLLLTGVLRIISQIFLIDSLGIVGASVAQIIMYFTAMALCFFKYSEMVGKNRELTKSISKILASSVIMSLSIYVSVRLIGSGVLRLVVSAVAGVAVYLAFNLLLKTADIGKIKSGMLRKKSGGQEAE